MLCSILLFGKLDGEAKERLCHCWNEDVKRNRRGKMKVICETCGKMFTGGRHAFYCPDCRKRMLSESAKKRNLNRIGIEARRKKKEG